MGVREPAREGVPGVWGVRGVCGLYGVRGGLAVGFRDIGGGRECALFKW